MVGSRGDTHDAAQLVIEAGLGGEPRMGSDTESNP
jgi:hypothetical protein